MSDADRNAISPESDSLSFEECLARLESTIRLLEDGQITLADSLRKYENGVRYLNQCYRYLEVAERRIELLTGFDAAGNPVTERFDEAEMTLEEKAKARGRRRTSKTGGRAPQNEVESLDPDLMF